MKNTAEEIFTCKKSASIQPRSSLSKFGGDAIQFFIRLFSSHRDAQIPGDALAVELAALEPALELGDGVHARDADPVHADDSVPDLDRARVRLVQTRNRAALRELRDLGGE